MQQKKEYQVTVSAFADPEYFDNKRAAINRARQLSYKQEESVIVDEHDGDELTGRYWTLTDGKLEAHL